MAEYLSSVPRSGYPASYYQRSALGTNKKGQTLASTPVFLLPPPRHSGAGPFGTGPYLFYHTGADRARSEVIGNIKFAAAPRGDGIEAIDLKRPYILAASTRDDEEKLIVRAWRAIDDHSHLLVIAPRHPKRLPQILNDLADEKVSVRSRGEPVTDTTTVYLADTFGELPGLIAGADLVFMGGSLVPKGGQNLLEAAALGKAPLFGPHMDNFLVEADVLQSEGGAIQVKDTAQLSAAIKRLLPDKRLREEMGQKAQAVIESRRDMAERYRKAIESYCDFDAS